MVYNPIREPGTRSIEKPSGRKSVGLVLASLHTGASVAAWPGVADAAERADVDLFCFPGGRIGLRDAYEASRNAIYDLAAEAPLDGALIWASTLSGADTTEAVEGFIDRYRDIPLASLSAGVEGVPIVTFDYYGGMREAVEHAAVHHGYRRIAFVRGPERHLGAQERYQAYLDTLKRLSLPEDPRLVSSPWPWDSGASAARELLDARGLKPGADFDALIAASDLMALWAVRELQSRGCRIPEDVAVIGMNNTIESRLTSPSLTTVDCPFAEMGALGLSVLLEGIERRSSGTGRPPRADERKLETKLVRRRSCGCEPAPPAVDDEPAAPGESAVGEAARAAGVSGRLERDWVGPLAEAWEAAVSGGGPAEDARFLDVLGRIADRSMRAGMEIGRWQGAITALRRSALRRAARAGEAPADRDRMEELAGRARVLVAEAAERSQAYRSWELERRDDALRALDHELVASLEPRGLSRILMDKLPPLGIESAYVCRYADYGPDGRAAMVAGFRDGRDLSGDAELSAPFPAGDLLPRGAFPDRRLSYVVEPLFFHDSPIGYALFEIGNRAGVVYERLRDSVSDALRGALMFERVEAARAEAVRADRIKSRLLTNVTHELRSPVDMILRGARKLLEELGPAGPKAAAEAERIRASAEHQKRLVNDLLDLSRAEIDELDLSLAPLDPEPALREVFGLFASQASPSVEWRIDLPPRLPLVMADEFRFRQVLINLLGNAAKFTRSGSIALSARIAPPEIRISVADTGPGIPEDMLPSIFEPFVSLGAAGGEDGGPKGVGLGLSIARHIAALHSGRLEAASEPGRGATFTLSLPLPAADGRPAREPAAARGAGRPGCILLVSSSEGVPPEIAALAAERGLAVRRIGMREIEEGGLEGVAPAAIAWDSSAAGPEERMLFRALRQESALMSAPLIVFGRDGGASALVDRLGAAEVVEAAALFGSSRADPGAPIVAADDDARALEELRSTLERAFPGARIIEAGDGEEALAAARASRPRLVALDLSMPGLSGIEVIRRMRADERLCSVPAILITSKTITLDDVRAIEGRGRVVLRNKGVLGEDEAAREAVAAAAGDSLLPAATSAIVKKAVAFLNARYSGQLTRWQVAQSVNASEDYLSRVFRRELGLTPWEYLTRLRIKRAKELLMSDADAISAVGAKVGFPDAAYFSRVFKKVTGSTPQAFREGGGPGGGP
jgi:signal transduction histidine kinase/DNA-binding LacI/PurR family transcriptional regulator/AraC-like DNA-binding protein